MAYSKYRRIDIYLIKDVGTKLLLYTKAVRYKLFFLKALTKWLWKLTIKTEQLSRLKSLSFLNFND